MPATQNYSLAKGRRANAALTKKRFVKLTTASDAVDPCSVAGELAYGVALFSVSAAEITKGKLASVMVEGRAIVEASAAINRGQLVATTNVGKAAVATTGQFVLGICDEPSTADTTECAVVLTPGGGKVP
jgi:hypothetical protein